MSAPTIVALSLAEAALNYAATGWPVFACKPGGKQPSTNNGFKAATTDAQAILAMWSAEPRANIGFLPGRAGLMVIDVDVKGGAPGMRTARALGLLDVPTLTVGTPSGGLHLYYQRPDVAHVGNTATLGAGIDVRCDAGYVLLPPSTLTSGGAYTWHPDEPDAQPLPDTIAAMLSGAHAPTGPSTHARIERAPTMGDALARRVAAYVDRLPSGLAEGEGRNNAAFQLAAFLTHDLAVTTGEAMPFVEQYNQTFAQPLDARELRSVVSSAASHGTRPVGAGLGDRVVSVRAPRHAIAAQSDAVGATTTTALSPMSVWPQMLPSSIYGLAGDVVRAFDPVTEADPAAVLATLLVAFANALNRGPHVMVSETRHPLNLFAVLVGQSSKARKGTSLNLVKSILRDADEDWTRRCITSGLSSGEGLIYNLRDASHGMKRVRNSDGIHVEQMIVTDAGIADKRLLVIEEEYASALRVMSRDGSTLSAIIRQAWDGADVLRSMTKNSPQTATSAHVGILGHVTINELRKELAETERANGFANRFLFVCARRSKELPDGGSLDPHTKLALAARLRDALQFGRVAGELRRTAAAAQMWRDVYHELSGGGDSMADALTARGEAQTVRLAALFAILDQSSVVDVQHLQGALDFWAYCEVSARAAFGEATGNAIAERIATVLRTDGPQTLNALRRVFSAHVPARDLEEALDCLAAAGRASATTEATGGRPRTTWAAT